MDKLHLEHAGPDHVSRLAGVDLGGGEQVVLRQLELHQAGGHPGGVDGCVDVPQHIGEGADVILVAVGEEDAPNLGLILNQVAVVGNDHVDAVHIVVGKAHAAVHHDNVVPVFVDGHVLADLVESAQRNDFQFFCHIVQ